MKKGFSLLLIVFILMSCDEVVVKEELKTKQILPSSLIDLTYPIGKGSAGDTKNGLLGYGFDLKGFCDTISVRAKIFENFPDNRVCINNPRSSFSNLLSGNNFDALEAKIMNKNIYLESGPALITHIKSLMKLALKTDTIDPNYACTYYRFSYFDSHRKLFISNSETQAYISDVFRNDIIVLTPKALVSKYGTHVLTDFYTGTKFEVLFRSNFESFHSESECEALFFNRMTEFIGGTPGIIQFQNPNLKSSQTEEQFIYNSIGSRNKFCGIINTTDYNPTNIRLDILSIFNDENIKTQFTSIGEDGILPIYELIFDEVKKQEVKTYIENYLSTNSSAAN